MNKSKKLNHRNTIVKYGYIPHPEARGLKYYEANVLKAWQDDLELRQSHLMGGWDLPNDPRID